MAKLRKIQFYRNGAVRAITNESNGSIIGGKTYLINDLKSAYVYAEALFKHSEQHKNMLDGEILLYRFSYPNVGQVHTLVGVVHVSGTGESAIHSLEVLANYDMLGGEISAAIETALDALDVENVSVATETDGIVTFNGIKQEDGKIATGTTGISLAKVATTGAAADVAVATGITGLGATNVQGALAELQGDITALQAIDPIVTTVVEGTGISVTPKTAEGGNDVTYTVAADFTVDTIKYGSDAGVKAGKTYIRIMDGTTIISETDADAFVKDGFLQKVELIEASEGQENVLRFTWNSDAGSQVTDIKVSELCDVYNVGAGLVASEDGYTFSHQAGATGLTAGTAFGSGSDTDNKITVKVPSVTVDEFGHVSALTETEVSLEIPASVASAVQTVTGDKYVTADKSGTTVTLATVTGDVANGEDKLATAQSVKTYVDGKIEALDADITSAEGTNVRVQVTEVDGKITAVNVTDNSINATNLKTAIEALDAEVTSADGTNVQVKVTEVDGKITAVNVTDNSINATNLKTAIEGLDATVSNVNALTNGTATNDIRVEVVETDGKLTAVNVTDALAAVAHSGKAADVAVAAKTDAQGNTVVAEGTVQGTLESIAAEIDAMDLAATDVVALNADKNALQASKISEYDGKVTVENAETLVEFNQALSSNNKVATMADVATAAALDGENAIVVTDATAENPTVVSLKIATGEKVLSQDANGLKSTLDLTYDSKAKQIKLWGKSTETPIASVDATDFIKDGMLADAEIITASNEEGLMPGKRYIKFTFKTYQYGVEGEEVLKVEYLDVESLIDSYTSGNDWIVIDQDANKISHQTQPNFTQEEGEEEPQTAFGGNVAEGAETDVVIEGAGQSAKFTVPSFVVDAAGHVTAAEDRVVKVALPAAQTAADVTVTKNETLGLTSENVQAALEELQGDINAINAVDWNGDGDGENTGEIIVNDTNHTISHKQHTVNPTTSVETTAVKSVVIPQLTVNGYGHVTAIENKTFNIDFNVPTVTGTEGQIVVTPTEATEDINYTVSLADVTRVDNPTADGTAGNPSTSSFADNTTTFTYVKAVNTDNKGRVTGIVTETVTEDFDAGTY